MESLDRFLGMAGGEQCLCIQNGLLDGDAPLLSCSFGAIALALFLLLAFQFGAALINGSLQNRDLDMNIDAIGILLLDREQDFQSATQVSLMQLLLDWFESPRRTFCCRTRCSDRSRRMFSALSTISCERVRMVGSLW